MTMTEFRHKLGPGWSDITKFAVWPMPQLTFTACLTGLLILMLSMLASIHFEGAPFETPVDRLLPLNDGRLALRYLR